MTTTVSVCMATYNGARFVRHQLESILDGLHPGDEVVVVDAASRTSAVRTTAEAAGVRCVRSERAPASVARNLGWRSATAPLVAFLDDDCRPHAGWAEAVVDALADLDVVCGRVVGDGAGHLSLLLSADPRDYDLATPLADLGHGANLAARRDALARIGGWDETLGPGTPWPGGEDKELLARALAAGLACGYRPDPVVTHAQWRSRRQVVRTELGYARGAGALARRGVGEASARGELRTAVRDLRAGYQLGAVSGVARAVGVVWGRTTGRRG
jgi:GT2 family glycosyltransferase